MHCFNEEDVNAVIKCIFFPFNIQVLNYRLKSARQPCGHSTVASSNHRRFSVSDLSSDSDKRSAHPRKQKVKKNFCSFDDLRVCQANLMNTSESASDLPTTDDECCHRSDNLPSTSMTASPNVSRSMQHIAFTETKATEAPQKFYGSDDDDSLFDVYGKRRKNGGSGGQADGQHKNDLQVNREIARKRSRMTYSFT